MAGLKLQERLEKAEAKLKTLQSRLEARQLKETRVKRRRNSPPIPRKIVDAEYKDRVRHGGRRSKLISESGYICAKCGKNGSSYEIVAHHVTGNNQEHEHQILLCRSCHRKEHGSPWHFKNVSKEQIEKALAKHDSLESACKDLGLTRSALFKKRKQFGMESRTYHRGWITKKAIVVGGA